MVSRLDTTLFASRSLQAISCAVIGTGALGSEIVRLLGQLGVGHVLLSDPDLIAETNLPHSIFFRGAAHVGEAKVTAIASLANQIFPDTRWTPIKMGVVDVPLSAIRECDLLFVTPDTIVARVESAHVARRLAKPSVDAALLGESWWRGRVTFFPAELEAACYLCQFTEQVRANLLARTASSVPGCSTHPPSADLASTPVMASITAALAVDTGLRALLSANPKTSPPAAAPVAFALEVSAAGEQSQLARHSLTPGSTCPWHEPSIRTSLRRFEGEYTSVADLLRANDLHAFMLEWPIVFDARCLDCATEYSPMAQVASFTQSASCPGCHSPHVLPVRTISEIDREAPEAQRSPAHFGLRAPCLASVR